MWAPLGAQASVSVLGQPWGLDSRFVNSSRHKEKSHQALVLSRPLQELIWFADLTENDLFLVT